MTHFAAFRVATFFVTEAPSAELKAKLGFREEARGANPWLVVPNDAGDSHLLEGWPVVNARLPRQRYHARP
jgi:hypothetical protein